MHAGPGKNTRLIVSFKDKITNAQKKTFASEHNIKDTEKESMIQFLENKHGLKRKSVHKGAFSFYVYEVSAAGADALIKTLNNESIIEYAEYDRMRYAFAAPDDYYLTQGEQWWYNKISASAAYDAGLMPGDVQGNIIAAVLDSGLYDEHPDITGLT
ncbi:MAG: hypothetical protein ACOC4H_02275, partial [bacterium]